MFVDRRPLIVQAVPYILAASVFIVLISLFTRRPPQSAVWPLRIFIVLCLLVAGWSFQFIYTHGLLYVNWPKLNTPAFAVEGYSDALNRAYKDQVVGPLIAAASGKDRRARNTSTQNMGHLEEGKKRIE
jgi:hypothetical protein